MTEKFTSLQIANCSLVLLIVCAATSDVMATRRAPGSDVTATRQAAPAGTQHVTGQPFSVTTCAIEGKSFNCTCSGDVDTWRCELELDDATLTYPLRALLLSLTLPVKQLTINIRNKNTAKTKGFVNTTLDITELKRFKGTLEEFGIGLEAQDFYETFHLKYDTETFPAVAGTLKSLRINVPLEAYVSQYPML